jgi:hypothetical protein
LTQQSGGDRTDYQAVVYLFKGALMFGILFRVEVKPANSEVFIDFIEWNIWAEMNGTLVGRDDFNEKRTKFHQAKPLKNWRSI